MTRIRFRYTVGPELKYLSHLDLMRLFQRALRRSGLSPAYSEGFNPHPRLALAAPLPVGVTAGGEYGDVYLEAPVSPDSFRRALGGQLPDGLALAAAAAVELAEPALAAVVNAALYRASWAGPAPVPGAAVLRQTLERMLSSGQIMIRRQGKDGRSRTSDIRPFILQAAVHRGVELDLLLQLGSLGGVSPFRVLEQLDLSRDGTVETLWRLHRRGLYIYERGKLKAPCMEGGEQSDGQKNYCEL